LSYFLKKTWVGQNSWTAIQILPPGRVNPPEPTGIGPVRQSMARQDHSNRDRTGDLPPLLIRSTKMFKFRKQFAGAIMGTLLGIAGVGGGGCEMSGLNTLLDTMNSWESDYDYYDSYDPSYNTWGPSSPGWDLLNIKSG
jgi:hypothetical protein